MIMNKSRVFGQNMHYYMKLKDVSVESLAQKLDYTVLELKKIFDARLFVDKEEKEDIAKALGVSIEDLMDANKKLPHDETNLIEYRGNFSNEENKEKILDLFDIYCDIQESLIREGLKPSL